MNVDSKGDGNVKQVVPFFMVSSMERSVHYYVDGLGFTMKNKRVVKEKLRWCWLEMGGAALMLQEHPPPLDTTRGCPRRKWARACRSAFNAKTPRRSTTSSGLAGSRPRSRSWETECGSPSFLTRTATDCSSKV
jgi:lactoylglutathione lyase